MKRLLLILALVAATPLASAQTVVISQYVETNTGNTPKGIEVWNPSSVAVDFAATPLTVFQGTNGAAPAIVTTATINTGTLAPNAVLVIGTSDIGTYLTANAPGTRFVTVPFVFNGDDALQLRLGGTVVDVFGTPGVDPGTEFAGNGVSTANQNIQLTPGITAPTTTGFSDPSTRFSTVSVTPATLPAGLAGFGVAPAPGPETVTVTFDPATATVAEGGTATITVFLDIATDTGAAGLNDEVTGTVVVPGANAGDVVFTGSFTFAAGRLDGDSETITVTVTDDTDVEAQEDVPFTFDTVTGGTGSGTFTLTIPASDQPPTDVTVTQTVDDVAGYRLLSAPVLDFTVTDLAEVNLVQGIDAGASAATFPAQYPGGTQNVVPNVYPEYDGTGYVPAATTADVLEPGRGFFWQLYDQTITEATLDGFETQFGSGTSESFELGANPTISATGLANTATVTQDFTSAGTVASGFLYMAGNPFAEAMTADGVTGDGPGLNNFVQVYDPVLGFQQLPRDVTTELSTWQGFFVEALGAGDVTVTYDADTRTGTDGTLVGRTAAVQGVALALAGLTADNAATADRALVHVTEAATAGFDADDASKLTPPAAPYALLAAVGTRQGAAYRQSVASLSAAEGLVALAFTATHAGTYTLTAEAMGLPVGVTAELRDLATGAVVDAAAGYTFTSDATDWTERFELAFRGAVAGENGPAAERTLSAPRPNPATGLAAMTLRLPAAERVTAVVVDALGRTVATVFDGEAAAGVDVNLSVDAARLAPGVYVIRVQGATFTESRRLTVVR